MTPPESNPPHVSPSPLLQSDRFLGKHSLIAVSGGADSMALLDYLASIARRTQRPISAAHFDHRLRPDSHRDRTLVERFCRERGIPCYTGAADVGAWADEHGESIEAAARRLRYEFLERTADEIGADRIVTAHTRDDNVETVFMRIMRGSGIRGLGGIPRRRGRVVRPILDVPRSQTVDYCRQMKVPFIDDPSNRDTAFERNYVRHEVLPPLRTSFRDVDARLLDLARDAADTVAVIRTMTDPVLDEHLAEEAPGVWRLSLGAIDGLNPMMQYVLFGDAIYHRIGHEKELSRDHYHSISRVTSGEALMQSLPGMTVRREHDHLVFYCGVDPDRRSDTIARGLPLPGSAHMFGFVVESREFTRAQEDRASWRARSSGSLETGGELTAAVAYFAREHVTPPFIVRPAAPGDRMCPFGMGGHQKKLSDIFIDRKIPYRVRGVIPVVCDQRRIIWVPGAATSDDARVTDATLQVVEMQLTIE